MKAHAWYRWNTICLENNWLTDRLYVEAGQHISFDYMQQDLQGSTGIHNYIVINHPNWHEFKLEQLERRPMITHTSDSHQIPSQNNTKSKLQILKNCQNFKC